MNKSLIALSIVGLGILAIFTFQDSLKDTLFSSQPPSATPGVQNTPVNNDSQGYRETKVIAENLKIPWEIATLPTGELLVTERPGTLLKIANANIQTIQEIEGVEHRGEGGLLGLALHPDFESNRFIYLYLTTRSNQGITNRVERYVFKDDTLSQKMTIIEGIPGANYHDGGRIAFGPDGYLYITTGDAGQPDLAQETSTLHGKILRLSDDGSIPGDNPFQNSVYSYGHRNPQGLAWDASGQLWSTEHGPSGAQSGCDEVNRIESGGNYGWPDVRCEQEKEGTISPALQSGRNDTWAPASALIIEDKLYFTGLRGAALFEVTLNGSKATDLTTHLYGEYGRLRALTAGPDGAIYLSTSNTDGRGNTNPGDDKLIHLNKAFLE